MSKWFVALLILGLAVSVDAEKGNPGVGRGAGNLEMRLARLEQLNSPLVYQTESQAESSAVETDPKDGLGLWLHSNAGTYRVLYIYHDGTIKALRDLETDPRLDTLTYVASESDPTLTDDGAVTMGDGASTFTLTLDGATDAAGAWDGTVWNWDKPIGTTDIRVYEGVNYISFTPPALSANTAYVFPAADGDAGQHLSTDGSANLTWGNSQISPSWALGQTDGAGTHYIGGFYIFGTTDNDFTPAITFGEADNSHAAHFFVVTKESPGATCNIQVSGTSITDGGVKVAADTVLMEIPFDSGANAYYETEEKWLGEIGIDGTDGGFDVTLCNYGFTKYWDDNNNDFTLVGIESTWKAGATDAAADIIIRHHRTTGWTYNAGAEPTPPTAIASLQTDYGLGVVSGEQGAWKRDNFDTDVDGTGREGLLIELTTGAAGKTFASGTVILTLTQVGSQ